MDIIRESENMPSLESWKERAVHMVGSARCAIDEKVATVRPRVEEMWRRVSMKTNQLRRNPAIVGGIAAAGGLALGLAGRWMRHRAHAPTLLIVETC